MTTHPAPQLALIALSPCPFCGGSARLECCPTDHESTHWWIQCFGCGATNGESLAESTPDQEFAITAWNTRPQSRPEAELPESDNDMLPDALVPHSSEWYRLCERRFAVDKIEISGVLAEAIVEAIGNLNVRNGQLRDALRRSIDIAKELQHKVDAITLHRDEQAVAHHGEMRELRLDRNNWKERAALQAAYGQQCAATRQTVGSLPPMQAPLPTIADAEAAIDTALSDALKAVNVLSTIGWLPIESAETNISVNDPTRCLVYGPEIGVQFGAVWKRADGTAGGRAEGFQGDWKITHFRPEPGAPLE